MISLNGFPELQENRIPVSSIDGQIMYSSVDSPYPNLHTSSLASHPEVVLTRETEQSQTYISPDQLFLPTENTTVQRIQDAWHDNGLEGVFETLEQEGGGIGFLGKVGHVLLSFFKQLPRLRYYSYEDSDAADVERESNFVVSIAWHPHSTKLAVATADDIVTIYSASSPLTPTLKAKQQRRITSVAWRPSALNEIAVGCSAGVYIWNVDPTSRIIRPPFSSTLHLPCCNVKDLAWSPHGDVLLSCDGVNQYMLAWEVDSVRSQPLRRTGGGGVFRISWSPDGSKVLAATNGKPFRVWTTTPKWTVDKWLSSGGAISCSAWSKTGNILLFSTKTQPLLYCLQSTCGFLTSPEVLGAHVVMDVTRISVQDIEVGGEVTGLAWDPNNEFLAVIFKDSPLIAVFKTVIFPSLQITPGFFINDWTKDTPAFITFQKNFKEGANLTICWSSGRIQYFPIVTHRSPPRKPNFTGMNALNRSTMDQSALYYSF